MHLLAIFISHKNENQFSLTLLLHDFTHELTGLLSEYIEIHVPEVPVLVLHEHPFLLTCQS